MPKKHAKQKDGRENLPKFGFLLVISGASGSGKDTVMAKLLEHPLVKALNLKKVVTCTDRSPRQGEIHGVDYHFVTNEKLMQMDRNGELVEDITLTGSSNKATPKSEIEKLLRGEDLIWRIDPSRAAEIASGTFFKRFFEPYASMLQKNTLVLCITATKNVIESRRKHRDGEKYNPNEYKARDSQEAPHLRVLAEKAVLIENFEGELTEVVETTTKVIIDHHAKTNTEVEVAQVIL